MNGEALLTIACSQVIGDKAAHNGNDEQEVRTLMRNWDEAYMRRDTDALDRILADDFIFTDAVGAVSNKARYVMTVIKSPDMTLIEPLGSDDVIMCVYGDAAVVTGRSPIKGRSRRTATNDLYRFTHRWVRGQGALARRRLTSNSRCRTLISRIGHHVFQRMRPLKLSKEKASAP